MATTFEPQALTAPLNDPALEALENLKPKTERNVSTLERNNHNPTKQYTKSRELLSTAAGYLTTLTSELNERAYELKTENSKRKRRRQEKRARQDPEAENDEEAGNSEVEAEAEADARCEAFQNQAQQLTDKMDMSMRGIVDDLNWLQEYPEILKRVAQHARDIIEVQRSHFASTELDSSRRKAKCKQRHVPEYSDEELPNAEDNDEDEHEDPPMRPRKQPTLDPAETPHVQLSRALAGHERQWNTQTLTERYARDNDYTGLKSALWEAQNPGDGTKAPPMPHRSMWFAVEEGRAATSSFTQQRNQHNDASFTEPGEEDENQDDTELEISGENARIKCPITLLPYQTPMTSKNCGHSYEKEAILHMLENSPIPLSAPQEEELRKIKDQRPRDARRAEMNALQPKRVRCPDAGCSVDINGEEDLYENQLLKRRVARYLARVRQDNALATDDIEEAEDDDDEDRVGKSRSRGPLSLGSSPVVRSAGPKSRTSRRVVKDEGPPGSARTSIVPDSQVGEDTEESSIQNM